MIAWLASLLALAFDLTYAKSLPDELAEVDAADDDLTPRFALAEVDALLGLLALDRLDLDQCDVARFRVVEVSIAFEAAASVSHRRGHRVRRLAVFAGKKDRLDSARVVAHLRSGMLPEQVEA